MTKFRPHRGSLAVAMKECVDVDGYAGLRAHLRNRGWAIGPADVLIVEKYGGHDERIGWNTHIVLVNGRAIGFTDGPLEPV